MDGWMDMDNDKDNDNDSFLIVVIIKVYRCGSTLFDISAAIE